MSINSHGMRHKSRQAGGPPNQIRQSSAQHEAPIPPPAQLQQAAPQRQLCIGHLLGQSAKAGGVRQVIGSDQVGEHGAHHLSSGGMLRAEKERKKFYSHVFKDYRALHGTRGLLP